MLSVIALLMSVCSPFSSFQVLVYTGVPEAVTPQLKANEWANTVLGALGGKGGGKPTTAQVRACTLVFLAAFFCVVVDVAVLVCCCVRVLLAARCKACLCVWVAYVWGLGVVWG